VLLLLKLSDHFQVLSDHYQVLPDHYQNSPPPSPLPPRTCQSLGQIVLPRSRSHSPSCSDISSINGDTFSEEENSVSERSVIVRPAPKVEQPAGKKPTFRVTQIIVTKTMEAFEKENRRKHTRIEFRMRYFSPDHLAEGHLATFDDKMQDFEVLVEEFVMSVDDLCIDYKIEMGPTKERYWTDLIVTVEAKMMAYRSSMTDKAMEIRNNIASTVSNGDSRSHDSTALKRQELQKAERAVAAQEKANADRLSETLREAETKKSAAPPHCDLVRYHVCVYHA
jgi:hypothetical protein